jgi:hypothetical protein
MYGIESAMIDGENDPRGTYVGRIKENSLWQLRNRIS